MVSWLVGLVGGEWIGYALLTYTWVFRMDTVAEGVCGDSMTETAIRLDTMKATVIMKLDEFWRRTREECILSRDWACLLESWMAG